MSEMREYLVSIYSKFVKVESSLPIIRFKNRCPV